MPGPHSLSALRRRLTPTSAALLGAAEEAAVTQGASLYLVGGVLRDLLPADGRHSRYTPGKFQELDLAVEGDALALADALIASLDPVLSTEVTITRHDRFGTATLRLRNAAIDLARTRRERYARPGVLPQVSPATIEDDLARRDFSINAMALGLSGPLRGTLLDPFDGQQDHTRGLIRVLHAQSFADDPTRLIRACRYAARIKGRLAPATLHAAQDALPFLQKLSPSRFGEAWRRLLSDPAAADALRNARRLGASQAWEQDWNISPRLNAAFAEAAPAGTEPSQTFWALTGLTLPPDITGHRLQAALPRRCTLQREERGALAAGVLLRDLRSTVTQAATRPSQIAAFLRPLPDPTLGAAERLWRGRSAERIGRYRREWNSVAAPIDAAALCELGVAAGPDLGRWLALLRDARLDGDLPSGRGAARIARRWVQSAGGRPQLAPRMQDRSARRGPEGKDGV